MPAERGPCFYCSNPTLPIWEVDPRRRYSHRHEIASVDHIYPRRITDKVLASKPKTPRWHVLNTVLACQDCNNYKGGLHPLDWLVIMPNNYNAARLAERLVELGEDMQAVFSAMQRRKK